MLKITNNSTESIIDRMGYEDSENLFYYNDLYNSEKVSFLAYQTIKVLKELKPYAFYCLDNQPFVLFFNNINNFNSYIEFLQFAPNYALN